MISLSPNPIKRPFDDENEGMSMNNQNDEQPIVTDSSGFKRIRRTCQFGDDETIDNDYYRTMSSFGSSNGLSMGKNSRFSPPSSSSSFIDSSFSHGDIANEENQSPIKTNTNRFMFTDMRLRDKRRRFEESLGRSHEYGAPGTGNDDHTIDKDFCNSGNEKEVCYTRCNSEVFKCRFDTSSNNHIPLNPAHMQTMYEAQLANLKKEMAQNNAEIQALRTKNNTLSEDNKILKRAVNIQESRQKEMASYNQELESTLRQAVDHIAGLEKVVQSLKSRMYGSIDNGPSYHLDEPPPDVY